MECNYHSIQTMGTLDGPGIRYVLFLQGCCFRCLYCHNPDTWLKNDKTISLEDILKDIIRYKEFYLSSGGGVTVSGGEPLLQIPFLIELFKKLRKYWIHTAVDTCGFVDITDEVQELIQYTDLFLLDIKHLDSDVHRRLTMCDNAKVLKFLDFLNENGKAIWIRQVLVPELTMDADYIDSLIKFLKNYDIERVELLPYHDMGKEKYKNLGLEYRLNSRIPSKEEVDEIKERFRANGFDTV